MVLASDRRLTRRICPMAREALHTPAGHLFGNPQSLPSLSDWHNMVDPHVRSHRPDNPLAPNRRSNSYIRVLPNFPQDRNKPQSLPVGFNQRVAAKGGISAVSSF